MPQKIDVHGLFIDPEAITDLLLQKRIAVLCPVFYEVGASKSIFGRFISTEQHKLRFDHQQPYGIILSDKEEPDPKSYIMNYRDAIFDKLFRDINADIKKIRGHIAEALKIEISGDRAVRILQSGRNVKQVLIREIPAKVRLSNGQWVDVFKSSPGYDFQDANPYAVTDVAASALMINTKDKNYVLFGAGVDASSEEVVSAYRSLAEVYNAIQAKRDESKLNQAKKPLIQFPQINIQLPKVELPKIELPPIRLQSPFAIGKKPEKPEEKALPEPEIDEKGNQ